MVERASGCRQSSSRSEATPGPTEKAGGTMRVLPNPRGIKHVKIGEGFCVRADLLRGIDSFIRDALIHDELTTRALYDSLIEAKVLPTSEALGDWYQLLQLRLRRGRLLLELKKTGGVRQ
jgi:hypothetical protein